MLNQLKRLKVCIALYGKSSQSYRAPLAIWDHTVLSATRHKWTCPALTPANQAGTRFTYPGGMKGWVDLHVGSLIAARLGIKPTTASSQVRCPSHYATEPPLIHLRQWFNTLIPRSPLVDSVIQCWCSFDDAWLYPQSYRPRIPLQM